MAANKILFISNNMMKSLYVLDTNIDDKILNTCIFNAQEYFILRLLGTRLYQRVWNEIDTNVISTDVRTLLDEHIAKCLPHYSMSELYKHLSFRLTNKGTVQKESEKSNAVEYNTLNKLRQEEIERGNFFAEQMVRYILANTSLFPEYTMITSIADLLPSFSNYGKIGYGYSDEDIRVKSYHCKYC